MLLPVICTMVLQRTLANIGPGSSCLTCNSGLNMIPALILAWTDSAAPLSASQTLQHPDHCALAQHRTLLQSQPHLQHQKLRLEAMNHLQSSRQGSSALRIMYPALCNYRTLPLQLSSTYTDRLPSSCISLRAPHMHAWPSELPTKWVPSWCGRLVQIRFAACLRLRLTPDPLRRRQVGGTAVRCLYARGRFATRQALEPARVAHCACEAGLQGRLDDDSPLRQSV